MEQLAPDLVLTQELCDVCAVAYDDVLAVARTLPRVPRVALRAAQRRRDSGFDRGDRAVDRGVGARRGCGGPLRERLTVVAERVAGASPPRVLCLEWLDPPMVGGHWVPEMVALAGGVDVLGPLGAPSMRVSWEEVSASNPDLVVLMPCGYDLPTTLDRARELCDVPAWRALPAVRAGRVYAVDGSGYFNRPGHA